jgi:hypothetical protein
MRPTLRLVTSKFTAARWRANQNRSGRGRLQEKRASENRRARCACNAALCGNGAHGCVGAAFSPVGSESANLSEIAIACKIDGRRGAGIAGIRARAASRRSRAMHAATNAAEAAGAPLAHVGMPSAYSCSDDLFLFTRRKKNPHNRYITRGF